MQAEVRALVAEVHGWLERVLKDGAASGQLEFQGDSKAQAVLVGATVQGALAIARAFSAKQYDVASTQLKRQMLPTP